MLLNHLGKRVHEAAGEEALCPLCKDRLAPRVCTKAVAHWAHFPKKHNQVEAAVRCPHFESRWHLLMKLAYRMLAGEGWEIEVPVALDGVTYLLDAVNRGTGEIREFVHTLTPYYGVKHACLLSGAAAAAAGIQNARLGWIYDGEMFIRKRPRRRFAGRYASLLKPKSSRRHSETGGCVDARAFIGSADPDLISLVPLREYGLLRYRRDQEWEAGYPANMPELRRAVELSLTVDFDNHANNPAEIKERVEDRLLREMVRDNL